MRAVMYAVVLLSVPGLTGWIGYRLGRRHERTAAPAMGADERELRLREAARLMAEAGDAHLRGEIGMSDLYGEAALRMLGEANQSPKSH